MKFFDRKYKLQVGDFETREGLVIDNLQVQFKVKKSINNKEKIDQCSVVVYNLSDQSLAKLETDFPVAILSCGYGNQLVRLFYGEIIDVETTKQGTDRVTKLDITPSYSELTFKLISELIPENGIVQDAIEAVRRQTDIAKGVYKGNNLRTKIVYGYPLSGTPKEMLDLICSEYNLQWRIENNALFINDAESVENESKDLAIVISPESGLIDKPYWYSGKDKKDRKDKDKKEGIRFKALLNPSVLPGSLIKIEYKEISEFFKVEEVDFSGDFRGNDWYMDCICSRRPED